MKNLLCFTVASLFAHTALAADPAYLGKPDCRIAALDTVPAGTELRWSGACEGGHAQGKGVLKWKDADNRPVTLSATLVRGEVSGEADLVTPAYEYAGTLKKGVPHGEGFFKYADGEGMYEGGVVNGKREGKGIFISPDRSRYTGEWKNGVREGWGEETFTLGGSYAGRWEDNRFHGQGKIVYAGSGRAYEGRFVWGRPAHQAHTKVEYDTTERKHEGKTRWHGSSTTYGGQHDAAWDALTEAQKNNARWHYKAMEAGDEPPYPAKGPQEVMEAFRKVSRDIGGADGMLRIYVLVGKDGKGKSATVYQIPTGQTGHPNKALAEAYSSLLMLDNYKPARCHGEPCEMLYPLEIMFGTVQRVPFDFHKD
ncbi:MORN repeat-containing protein [Telluria sp. B2]